MHVNIVGRDFEASLVANVLYRVIANTDPNRAFTLAAMRSGDDCFVIENGAAAVMEIVQSLHRDNPGPRVGLGINATVNLLRIIDPVGLLK